MREKIVSLLLICGLALTACTNSVGENTASTESAPVVSEEITETEASETAKYTESEAEPESIYPEFTGIDISEEGLAISTVNVRSSITYHTFCYSEDMIYFSDINKGWKLYSYDGENVNLILDKKAYYLHYYDNSIYFLSDRNVSAYNYHIDGILYKYDIKSKEVTKLTDDIVYIPRADETGIYYSKEYEDKYYVYRLDEQSGEEERLYEGFAYYRIGDYVISREVIGKKGEDDIYDYFLLNDDEKICFISDTTIRLDFIHNGVFYYKDWENDVVHSVDLRTGENDTLHLKYNFVILDDEIYFLYGPPFDYLYRWQDGNPELIFIVGINIPYNNYKGNWEEHDGHDYGVYNLKKLFTDKKSLYAYVYPPTGDDTELYITKLVPLEDGSGEYVLDFIN